MSLSPEIVQEVTEHFTPRFVTPDDFVCIYGSSVYSADKTTSDVDLFLVSQTNEPADLDVINDHVGFVRDMHTRHGRKIDEEVPFANKLRYTRLEVEDALALRCFVIGPDGSIAVPPVRKEASFLNSPEIKARLALNALTTPHMVIGGDLATYHTYRLRAEQAVTVLAMGLNGQLEFDRQDLFTALTVGPEGEAGEMHLGYKTEYPMVIDRLSRVLDNGLSCLATSGKIAVIASGVARYGVGEYDASYLVGDGAANTDVLVAGFDKRPEFDGRDLRSARTFGPNGEVAKLSGVATGGNTISSTSGTARNGVDGYGGLGAEDTYKNREEL